MSLLAATLAGVLLVAAPVKDYVHPDESVNIRFLQSDKDAAPKLVETVGLKAVDVPDTFTPALAGDILTTGGDPVFKLYTPDGKEVKAQAIAKADLSKGVVDVAAAFPQIKEGGTFILTWKTAQPLVIETLYNPGRGPKDLAKLPEAQREQYKDRFAPTITHIVPLQYALISTDKGEIKATFDYAVAPHTVDNFVSLANQGYYNNSRFHRIIKGFMIQGGDSMGASTENAGTGGPGYQIMAEFSDKPHNRGVLSMARSQDPNSAGGQFFIMHGNNEGLNGQYTAFGQVIEGMNVVDKIAQTPVTDNNGSTKPEDRPKILSVKILPATPSQYGIK